MATLGNDIVLAGKLLEQGELVAIPSETVYGLGCNALNPQAVARIFEVKDRPHFNPLIVHVRSLENAGQYVTDIPEQAQLLASHFWPGPLTLLLPKKKSIPDLVTAGLDRVGIRCPDHSLTRQLLELVPFPLAAPSANPSGYVSPTTAQHVEDQLGRKIPYILDGGPCRVGIESTIIGWEEDQAVIYRLGGIATEQIEKVIGKVRTQFHASSQPSSPGQLQSHYAPLKPFYLGNPEKQIGAHRLTNTGVLTFLPRPMVAGAKIQLALAPSG